MKHKNKQTAGIYTNDWSFWKLIAKGKVHIQISPEAIFWEPATPVDGFSFSIPWDTLSSENLQQVKRRETGNRQYLFHTLVEC